MFDCDHPHQLLAEKLRAILSLHTKKMDFRLDEGAYIDLLTALGNPHLHLPPVIHIAGTNGKGSTLAFIKSLYEAAGLSVHTYTSPHLMTFNERIVLAGKEITDDSLNTYLDMVEAANKRNSVTFFEYTTALAFKAFADYPADICVLETGLGGRLDCTNVVPNPVATVITPIGYDHTEWLGDDIHTIAREKAGIMKAGAPCFVAPQTHDVCETLQACADEVGCDIHFIERMDDLPALGLVGDHQKDNASVAISILLSLRKQGSPHKIPAFAGMTDEIKNALQNTYWPARMEKLCPRPDRGSSQTKSPEIWFDCGHNADGARVIAEQFKAWKAENPNCPIHLVLGLAADKDPNDFLKPLIPYLDTITCVDLLNARNPQSADDLTARINSLSIPVKTAKTIEDIELATDTNAITFITGSLYLYERMKSKFSL